MNKEADMKLFDGKGYAEGGVYFLHFVIRESADIIGEHGFINAHQIVAEDGAVVFQPFINTDFDLCTDTAVLGVDRGANNRGETLIDKSLPGNNKKNTVFLRIVFCSFIDPVEFAPFHRSLSSKIGFWYKSTSSTSALSLSAWRRKYSASCAAVILCLADFASAGLNEMITDSVGISRGTSMISLRSLGIFMVCVRVIEKP